MKVSGMYGTPIQLHDKEHSFSYDAGGHDREHSQTYDRDAGI